MNNPWNFNSKKRKNDVSLQSPNKRQKIDSKPSSNTKSKSSSNTKSKPPKKSKKPKTTTKAHKRLSVIILKKTYNSIINVFKKPNIANDLSKHIQLENSLHMNDKNEMDDSDDDDDDDIKIHKMFPKIQINEEEMKEFSSSNLDVSKRGKMILDNLNFLVNKLQLPADSSGDIVCSNKISNKECKKILREKYNDPIKESEDDQRWYCIDICVKYYKETDFKMFNKGRTDVYVVGGRDRLRPDRALKHCEGMLHKECDKRKSIDDGEKVGDMTRIMAQMTKTDREILCRDVLIVHGDYRRGTISSHCFTIQRTLSSKVDHFINLKYGENKKWEPKLEDMQYGNSQRHDFLRGEIAKDVRLKKVKLVVEAAGARNHLVDGWDNKGEKYNNFVNISNPDGSVSTVWLGLVNPISHGAKGEFESMLKSYEINGIEHSEIRAESITFDGPKQHTGNKNGVGVRYQRDCADKGFGFIPAIIICNGHKTQNMKKDCFNKSGVTTKSVFFHPIDDEIKCYIEIEQDLKILAIEMNKSNYSSIFKRWSVENGFDVREIVSMSKHKEIRFNDHYTTSVKQTVRNIVALLLWWMHLLCDKGQPIALRNLAYKLLSTWSNTQKLRLLFINLDHSDVLNYSLNMVFQNNEDTWIGDARTQPQKYIQNVNGLKANVGKYETMFEQAYDSSTGTFCNVPLIITNDFDADVLDSIRIKICDRYILCCSARFKMTKYIECTEYLDPIEWKDVDHDTVNDNGLNVFIYEYGTDAIKYYHENYYMDCDLREMIRGYSDSKRFWLFQIHRKKKEIVFRALFKRIIRETIKNSSCVMNCKGGYLKFIHRVNSNKTDAMLVETGNAKLTVIFGINRNFGINGINEAGTIAINSDCISTYNPLPVVDMILKTKELKKRKVINREKWKSKSINIGIFEQANARKNETRKKNRQKMQHIAKPKALISVDINSIKSKINKMRNRKLKASNAKQQKQTHHNTANNTDINSNDEIKTQTVELSNDTDSDSLTDELSNEHVLIIKKNKTNVISPSIVSIRTQNKNKNKNNNKNYDNYSSSSDSEY